MTPRQKKARDALLDAATEVACLTNEHGVIYRPGTGGQRELSAALEALYRANDEWQECRLPESHQRERPLEPTRRKKGGRHG